MGDDDAASKAMEERIKVLEEAVRNSSSQGQARWTSLLKIGAICGVVVVILLVLLGPLLPAVYSLEYVFRGGAFHDQVGSPVPVAPKEAPQGTLPPSQPDATAPLVAGSPPPLAAPPAQKRKAKPKRKPREEVAGVSEPNPAAEAREDDSAASPAGDDVPLPLPPGEDGDRLSTQRGLCLGAPFPVLFGDGGATRNLAFEAYQRTRTSRGYLRNAKLDPVLAALERDKRRSRGGRGLLGKEDSLPLKPFCSRRRRPVGGNLEDLTTCLMTPDACTPQRQANATSQLNGVSAIRQYLPGKGSPKCVTVNAACGVRPRDLTAAKESGKKIGIKAGERIVRKQPPKDLPRSMGTCAIVANGPGLYAEGVGEAIDAHDVVIKMNLYHLGPDRPGKFLELDKSASLYSGKRSSIRMFNAKRAEDVMKYGMMPTANETWVYWHYRTAISLDTLIKINPNARFLAPDHLNRMIELYFAFRTLVIQVAKIRRTKCPINLSTGIHSVLTYIHTCDRVNLFGFSTRWSDMQGRGRKNEVISSRMSRSHDWNVDVMILNLLAISRLISVPVFNHHRFFLFSNQ